MGDLATEENAGYLAAGYAIIYGGAFVLNFYPAFVLGVQVSCICIYTPTHCQDKKLFLLRWICRLRR